jgi:hypothetical protein
MSGLVRLTLPGRTDTPPRGVSGCPVRVRVRVWTGSGSGSGPGPSVTRDGHGGDFGI